MSEEERQPEMANSPAARAEDHPAGTEPPAAAVDAPPETAKGATVPVRDSGAEGTPALPGPAPKEISVPDHRELDTWNEQVRRRMRQKSRRSFLGLGAGLVAGTAAFRWLTTRREIDGAPWPFRKTLEVNEQLARDYFSTGRLSPASNPDRVSADRVNGDLGLDEDIDVATWKLEVQGLASQDEPLRLGLDAIKKLPRRQMTTEFKCIEGWSVVVEWAGARFIDFMKAYPPEMPSEGEFSLNNPEDLPPYVSMSTPDNGYYVGLDMESMLHPQTLLCYKRNGAPLSREHGAPLRLVIPVKYGVKNIKRIGTIQYSTRRPADYWAERGYDWYVGL
jgi:DMSO/TMAO reductase YedYZ molybdopterin-dependent catalytic subunit